MIAPTAKLNYLQQRAKILQQIRDFFAQRNVLEVETPLLCSSSATDPHIASFALPEQRYLQTSPEFPMKRLLAAGSGAIYQICKSFRVEEMGRYHNPEFTMLEWYRPDFDHLALMQEVDELLQTILISKSAQRITYAALFEKFLAFNPHQCSLTDLKNCAVQQKIDVAESFPIDDRDAWLQLLMAYCIEPQLGFSQPIFIYDFPTSQAALAKIRPGNPAVAERFEVYVKGIELANGYHELADAAEQRRRFVADNLQRERLGHPTVPIDEYLLSALPNFPDCAGVALGIDRLIMLALAANTIHDIISFSWNEV